MSENSELLDILKSEKGMASVPSKSARSTRSQQTATTARSHGSYHMAKLVINILTFFGFTLLAVGAISALVGMFEYEHIAGAITGMYLVIAGIFQLGFAQLLLAIVNTAIDTRATRDILEAKL